MSGYHQLKVIGRVHSKLKSLQDCPRQESENAPEAEIEIFAGFTEATENIRPGDKVILFTWLDKADRLVLKTRPHNDADLPLTGVFSKRRRIVRIR